MAEFRQAALGTVEKRAAIARALYLAFLALDERAEVCGFTEGGSLRQTLTNLKQKMAGNPVEPLLAYGLPHAEWAEVLGLLRGSPSKTFGELSDLVGDGASIPTPIEEDPSASVALQVVRPDGVKGALGGVTTVVTIRGVAVTGTFPEGQETFKAPRTVNDRVQEHRAAVGDHLKDQPGFFESVRKLLALKPRYKRHRVFQERDFGVDILDFRPKAVRPAAKMLVMFGIGLGAALAVYLTVAASEPLLVSDLRQTEGNLFEVALSWDTHGHPVEAFRITRRSPSDTTTETASSVPARLTGLTPGTTYTFRVARSVLGVRVPVTRATVVQVPFPDAFGPLRVVQQPPFGCTQIRVEPPSPRVGEPVRLSASLYGELDDLTLTWQLGDRTDPVRGSPVTVTFQNAGTYVTFLHVARPGMFTQCPKQIVVRPAALAGPTPAPTPPPATAALALPGEVRALAALGGTRLLALHGNGVAVVDIGDRGAEPRILGRVTVPGAIDLALHGTRAYVAGGTGGGLTQLDLVDPERPSITARDPGDVNNVAIEGSTLLASDWNHPEVRVFTLDDDGRPHLDRRIDSQSGVPVQLRFMDKTHALCALGGGTQRSGAGLARITLDTGTVERLVTSEDSADLAVVGDVVYLASPTTALNLVHLTVDRGLQTFPALQQRSWPVGTRSVSRIGTRIYASGMDDGWTQVFDVTTPATPNLLGALRLGSAVHRIIEVDGRLVAGTTGQLVVTNIPSF